MYNYLAFSPIEFDDRGKFKFPREHIRDWEFDVIVASFSWEEAATSDEWVALVAPVTSIDDPDEFIMEEGRRWICDNVEVVAGPFPPDSEEGKMEAARVIISAYTSGYHQYWGVVLWALRQLAEELPPSIINEILDRVANRATEHLYELAFVPALRPYLGGVRDKLRRAIEAGEVTRAIVSAFCALSGFSAKACKYVAGFGWDIGDLLIKEVMHVWARDQRVSRRIIKWVIRKFGFPPNPWEGTGFELSCSVLTHVKGSKDPDLLKYTDALIMRALKDDNIPFPPYGVFYLMDRGKLGVLAEISHEISAKKLAELFQARWRPRYDVLFDVVSRCLQRPEQDIWGVILYWAPQEFDCPWSSLINEIIRAVNLPEIRPHADRLLSSYKAVCGEELPYRVKEFLRRLNQALEKKLK